MSNDEQTSDNQQGYTSLAGVSGSYVFDRELLEKAMTAEKPYYAIGVDALDEKALVYCLTRKVNDKIEFLISKTMRDEKEFRQEIETLAKIFGADVYETQY